MCLSLPPPPPVRVSVLILNQKYTDLLFMMYHEIRKCFVLYVLSPSCAECIYLLGVPLNVLLILSEGLVQGLPLRRGAKGDGGVQGKNS